MPRDSSDCVPSDPPPPADALSRAVDRFKEAQLDGEALSIAALAQEFGVSESELREAVADFGDLHAGLLGLAGGRREPELSATPERVGVYRILHELGSGGMGVVYLAEQETPVRRRCALKLIKLGTDSRETLRRFQLEQETLALMTHRNVARVYDAGIAEDGRPYFVMEYVKGIAIHRYCAKHQLEIDARLNLFLELCNGVQHAHSKGIIHRDLKPSNVLVGEEDGKPFPKIIDFGLARALSEDRTERTLFTREGQIIGTLEYMSPEQAKVGDLDVDTRTDIYSLGVILYELLTGELPIASETLRSAFLGELPKLLMETEPLRPSAMVHKLRSKTRRHSTTDLDTISRAPAGEERSTVQQEPAPLSRAPTLRGEARAPATKPGTDGTASSQFLTKTWQLNLRGDLDWIVLKVIEREPEHRYQSVRELSNDLQRYLRHEPVLAAPPSAQRRFRKLLRRNRGLVATASFAILALIASALFLLQLVLEGGRRAAVREELLSNVASASLERRHDDIDAPIARLRVLHATSRELALAELYRIGALFRYGACRKARKAFALWWREHSDLESELPKGILPATAAWSDVLLPKAQRLQSEGEKEIRAALTRICRRIDPDGYHAAAKIAKNWSRIRVWESFPGVGVYCPDDGLALRLLHDSKHRPYLVWPLPRSCDKDGLVVLNLSTAEPSPRFIATDGPLQSLTTEAKRAGAADIHRVFWVSEPGQASRGALFLHAGRLDLSRGRLQSEAKIKIQGSSGTRSYVRQILTLADSDATEQGPSSCGLVLTWPRGYTYMHWDGLQFRSFANRIPNLSHGSVVASACAGRFLSADKESVVLCSGEWHDYSLNLITRRSGPSPLRLVGKQLFGTSLGGIAIESNRSGLDDLVLVRSAYLSDYQENFSVFGRFQSLGIRRGLRVLRFDPQTTEFRIRAQYSLRPGLGLIAQPGYPSVLNIDQDAASEIALKFDVFGDREQMSFGNPEQEASFAVFDQSDNGKKLELIFCSSSPKAPSSIPVQLDQDPEPELVLFAYGLQGNLSRGKLYIYGLDHD